MILNIFGPSGSGKTTFVRKLLKKGITQIFFEQITKEKYIDNFNENISITLIPLPIFRGNLIDFFDIFSIDINKLLFLDIDLKNLSSSIFGEIKDKSYLQRISLRSLETFSAGEMRRLFLLRSLLVDSDFLIVDEPFSNSDEKLWNIIFKAINLKPRSIILSHLSLDKVINLNQENITVDINQLRNNF